jgi:hypothetical protein
MKKIEYEIISTGISGHDIQDFSWEESLEILKDEDNIKFSVNVVKALEQKMKIHNKASENKVTLKQLKKVYRRAAGNVFAEVPEVCETKGQWAMARVNTYLRLLKGGDSSFASLKISSSNTTYEGELDLTQNLVPSTEDFIQTKADIDAYDLNYDFKNIEELYLDDNESSLGFIDFEL